MKRSSQHPVKAFTLIEVMLAATIMLAGVVGAIQVLVSGSEMLETSRKQAAALQIIDSELARARTQYNSSNWSSSAGAGGSGGLAITSTPTQIPLLNMIGSVAPRYPSTTTYNSFRSVIQYFTCSRTVSYALGRTDYKQVTVTVNWTNHNGRTYTRTGTTYVGKNGLYVSYQR